MTSRPRLFHAGTCHGNLFCKRKEPWPFLGHPWAPWPSRGDVGQLSGHREAETGEKGFHHPAPCAQRSHPTRILPSGDVGDQAWEGPRYLGSPQRVPRACSQPRVRQPSAGPHLPSLQLQKPGRRRQEGTAISAASGGGCPALKPEPGATGSSWASPTGPERAGGGWPLSSGVLPLSFLHSPHQ